VLAQSTRPTISANQPAPKSTSTLIYHWPLALVTIVLISLAALWFACDRSWPEWDAAEHQKAGSRYAELLHRPRPFKAEWLKDFCSVNYFYPPAVYITDGSLKLALGESPFATNLLAIIYIVVLSVGAYSCGYLAYGSRLAGALSALVLYNLPCVADLSHRHMLDFPLLAMCTAGVAGLMWWQRQPRWTNTILVGSIVAVALITKQIAGAFLAGPLAILWLTALMQRSKDQLLKLAVLSSVGLSLVVTWWLVNRDTVTGLTSSLQGSLGDKSVASVFLPNVQYYFLKLPELLTPALTVVAVIALWFKGKDLIGKLMLPSASLAGGLLLICALSFALPNYRYILPGLLLPCLLIAAAAGQLLQRSRLSLRLLGAGVILLSATQLMLTNYSPYPVPLKITAPLGRSAICPTPPGDRWGQEWVLDKIAADSGNLPCWLNVMPNTRELNVHTFEAIAKTKHYNVTPTTVIVWTPVGNRIVLPPGGIRDFQWILLKTGNQSPFQLDSQGKQLWKQIEDQVKNQDDFILAGERVISDGSKLSLYRTAHCDFSQLKRSASASSATTEPIEPPKTDPRGLGRHRQTAP
jgi:4-amino-4-deoxy-L-arabinose transferase-like glycosyltransferase